MDSGMHDFSQAMQQLINTAGHGFRGMNHRLEPFPNLLGRIVLRGIGRQFEKPDFRMLGDELLNHSGLVNGGIVENEHQLFPLRFGAELMKKFFEDRSITFACALPVKRIACRRVCPKYAAGFPFRRCPQGKMARRVCANRA